MLKFKTIQETQDFVREKKIKILIKRGKLTIFLVQAFKDKRKNHTKEKNLEKNQQNPQKGRERGVREKSNYYVVKRRDR